MILGPDGRAARPLIKPAYTIVPFMHGPKDVNSALCGSVVA